MLKKYGIPLALGVLGMSAVYAARVVWFYIKVLIAVGHILQAQHVL